MALSQRIQGLLTGGSDGWEVFNLARERIAAGEDIIELTIGEHDVRTDPTILDAMRRSAASGHTGYASVPGTKTLRDAIAARVTERTGMPTTRDNIVVTTGGQAALFAAHTATCDPGETALYIDPYYATYPGLIRATGARAETVPSYPEHGFRPRAQDVLAAPDAKSLLINSPNNPTGVVYPRDTMEDIANACAERDFWLISDEVYDTQIWNGAFTSAWSLPDTRARTLVVNSMSKSHAMTGSRIGWVLGPEDAIHHLINLSTHTTYGVPGYIQDAANFALAQGRPLEEKIAEPFRRRREIAMRVMQGSNMVKAVPCDGAMYIMLDIRGTGLTGQAFAYALLDSEKIAVMPGESFGQSTVGHLRIAMTVDDAKFEDAFIRLVRFAETQAMADAG